MDDLLELGVLDVDAAPPDRRDLFDRRVIQTLQQRAVANHPRRTKDHHLHQRSSACLLSMYGYGARSFR